MFKLIVLVSCFFICCGSLLSQDLVLTDGQRSKTIKEGKFIEIDLDVEDDDDCLCERKIMYGQYMGIENGQIKLILYREGYVKKNDEVNIHNSTKFSEEVGKQHLIDIESMVAIQKSPSLKKQKTNKVLNVIGASFILGGVMTSAGGLTLDDKDSRGNMVALGAVEFGVGIILASAVNSRRIYLLKKSKAFPNSPLYRIEH